MPFDPEPFKVICIRSLDEHWSKYRPWDGPCPFKLMNIYTARESEGWRATYRRARGDTSKPERTWITVDAPSGSWSFSKHTEGIKRPKFRKYFKRLKKEEEVHAQTENNPENAPEEIPEEALMLDIRQ